MLSPSQPRRVVVTGLGVTTALGLNVDTFWDNLCSGKSGITAITRFDPELFPCKVGGVIEDFDATQYMDGKEAKRNDRFTHLAVGASAEAVKDAGLKVEGLDKERFGVIIGSGIGGMQTIEDQSSALIEGGPRKVSAFMITSLISNMASGLVAIQYGALGPNYSIVSACSTGTHAVGDSFRMIQNGEADIMLTGGSEAAVTRLSYAGFCKMRAMSTQYNDTPERASRPFDVGRDGFVMGEGAGVLVLESLEHAQARGAKIYCELVGYAANCDAHHVTMPHPEGKGLARCLKLALKDADLEPTAVDYINAHGTSTPYNDKFETMAVKSVFGDHAYQLKMSSTKSMTGHLLGAAGGIESAVCAKALETDVIPPTINYDDPDPDCDLDYVPNNKIETSVNVAVCNNLGFGGHNASLIFKKFAG